MSRAEVLRYPDPPLRQGRVSLRRWELGDLPLVEEAARDVSLLQSTTLPSPYTPAGGRAFVERQWSRQSSGEGISLAIAESGHAVGSASLIIRRPGVADLGCWLVERMRGRGIAGCAIPLLTEWALEQPEVEAIEAFVDVENLASRRLLSRARLTEVGRRQHCVNDLHEELLVYRRSGSGSMPRPAALE